MKTFISVTIMFTFALSAIVFAPGLAVAKVLSQSEPEITQLRIITSTRRESIKPTAWGTEATYIGPGEIRLLMKVDIYLNTRNEIEVVKITRESTVGDIITVLFADVKEVGVQTLKKGANRPHKRIPIIIHTADDLTFP